MERDNKPLIHDTINLDEIRQLLGEVHDMTEAVTDEVQEVSLNQPEMPDDNPDVSMYIQEQDAELRIVDDEKDSTVASDVTESESASVVSGSGEDMTETDPLLDEIAALVQSGEGAEAAEPIQQSEEATAVQADSEPAAEKQEDRAGKKKTSFFYELHCMLHDVVYLLAAVTLVFVFLIRLVGVQGDSMLPTLHNQDYLLLESNFLYRGDDLSYGDIVVLNVPFYEASGEGPIVKRVIATEGQTVYIDFDSGAVYVDGVMLSESYTNTPTNFNWGDYGLEYPAVVPENSIFVLGDNRNDSMDSRYAPIGMIDERCVVGKVLVIALPGRTIDQAGNAMESRDWGRIGLVS